MIETKRTFLKRIGALASALAIAVIGSGCDGILDDDLVSASVTAENGDAAKTKLETSGIAVAKTGDKSAVDTALNYLTCMTFSRRQLIEQLRFDGFSTEEATQGVDDCGADWKEQALLSAQNYVDTDVLSYSYDGLIAQLTADGFSDEEALYGANNCTVAWNAQAVKKAKDYKEASYAKEDALKEMKEYDGFAPEQAEYGVAEAGF